MSVLRYAQNLGRSTAYALPQIIKNRIPSVHMLVSQFTEKGKRGASHDTLRDIKGIIKEDVLGLMKKGLDSAQKELKSGKMYRTEAEQSATFGEAFGMDESLLDNSFFDADFEGGEGGGDSTTASVAASAAAAGAASGVAAAAARLGDSPAQRAAAQAGMATAKFSRAQLGASIAVGNAIRGAVMANAQILGEIHRFQTTVQQDFYRKQVEHNMAMAAMTSEMLTRLAELKNVSTVAAAASDQIMQSFSGRQSDFSRVYGATGDFNVNEYLGVMANRLRQAVGDGSMFKAMGTTIAAGPLAFALEKALEGLIPKDFGKQLQQFNEFVGGLGALVNERARNVARRKGGAMGQLLEFLTIAPDQMATGPDLSKIVRGKAVAFDGYAHRSLVEVIPSHLADIHAELVAMRRARGVADPADRKLFDYKTGRFASERLTKAQFERDIERRSMSKFDDLRRTMGDGGDKASAKEIQSALRILAKEQFSINKGSSDDFAAQIDMEADRLARSGRKEDADRLRAGKSHLVRARKQYGPKFSAKLQRSIIDYNATHASAYDTVGQEEGVHRMMYSGGIYDAETRRTIDGGLGIAGAPAGGGKGKKKATKSVARHHMDVEDEIFAQGAGTGFAESQDSIFRDANGKVTVGSLIGAPMMAVSKAMSAFENKVSDIFFGTGKESGGIFGSIKQSLMGDVDPETGRRTGPLGRVLDYVKHNVFNPLKKAMVGDPSDPDSVHKSLLGTTKRWFREAVDSGKTFLFGKSVEGADGVLSRQGGLFGGLVNWFSGKSRQLKEMLLGKGGDDKAPGLLTGIKDKFDKLVARVQVAIFGTVDESGLRAGGLLGDGIQKGKNFLQNLWTRFQETAVKPLGVALFGSVGASGRRSGGALGDAMQKGKDFLSKLWSDTSKFVMQPLKDALFGKDRSFVDDMGNVVSKREGGILPMLSQTFKDAIVEPLARSFLGEKGADGTRQGGALKVVWQSMKDAMAPLKETFVGKDGIWTNMKKGLSDTFSDLKKSLFGDRADGDDRPFMERIGEKISGQIKRFGDWMTEKLKPVTEWIQKGGDWLKSKVFEPFNNWLNDPKTGFITKMREGTASFFYGKKNEDGIREGGLFGAVKKDMDRFFYGDPNDPNRKGFVERAVEPAKKFVLDEIWHPLKKNMHEMWDETKDFLKKEVWAPLQGVMQPFFTEAKEQWKNLKEWGTNVARDIGDSINATFKMSFGTSLTDMLRKNVLDPIKEALGSVRKFLMTSLKAVLKFPVNVLRGASDELAISQIKRGIFKGTAEERERLLTKAKIDPASVPHSAGSSLDAPRRQGLTGREAANDPTVSQQKKQGFFSRMFRGKDGEEAQLATAASAGLATGQRGTVGAAAKMGTSPAEQLPGGADGSRKRDQGGAHKSSEAITQRNTLRAAQATADNTSNMYQFMTKHLWGVGKNVERIVKHFQIKDTALGGNTDEKYKRTGLMGKLRRAITNPIGFVADMVTGVFDFMRKQVGRLFSLAHNIIMLPIKGIVKSFELLNKTVGGMRRMFGEIAGAIKDLIVGTLGGAIRITATIFKESAKAVGTVVSTIAKAIPDVASALASATVGILKAGGELALGAVKIAGALTETLVKVGASMITTAVKVTKDVVTGLARVTFDAIGSAFNMMTGRGRGQKTGNVTPVYVLGGYLAGSEGGVKSWEEAKAMTGGVRRFARAAAGAAAGAVAGGGPLGALLGAGFGFFSPELAERIAEGKTSLQQGLKRAKSGIAAARERIGTGFGAAGEGAKNGWKSIKDRTSKATAAVKELQWKEGLLSASEKTKEHLGSIRSGFSRFGSMLMMAIPALVSGIGSLVTFFTKGRFISLLAGLLGRQGLGDTLTRRGGATRRGAPRLPGGGMLKGIGIGALTGFGGSMIKDAADGMEDGAAKTAVKTGGAMLEYGGMGAMIGSVIPGVGTAVGAGVGAAVGAVVENWDYIVSAARGMWEFTKEAGHKIGEAASWLGGVVKSTGTAVWGHFFGNDVQIDEDGKVVRQEKRNLLGRIWEGLVGGDQKQLADGQIVKEGGVGLLGNVKNSLLNTVGIFGKLLSGDEISMSDFTKGTVLEGAWDKITGVLSSFGDTLTSIGSGLFNGFKYVTELRFIDDMKSAITNWWSDDPDESVQEADGTVGPADSRPWYKRLGQSLTSWADGNRSTMSTVTVDKDGKPIANRAFGGPLGKNGTLVGELGPELVDTHGNVISASRFQNPALVSQAQERKDSVSSILQDTQKNSFYTTSLLSSINAALGGKPVAVTSANDPVFDPRKADLDGSRKPQGLFGAITSAFGIDQTTVGKVSDAAAVIGSTASEAGSHAVSAVRGAASSLWTGMRDATSAALRGEFSQAGSALRSGVSGASQSLATGASSVGAAVSAGVSDLGAVIRGDGAKNLEVIRAAMQQFGMTNPNEQAMFLSQLDHESGGFKQLSENLRYTPENLLRVFPRYFRTIEEARQVAAGGPQAIANRVYGGRMGNTSDGDGFKYRGRGFIQLTGRDNYVRAGRELGIDLENNPDLAAEPENAAKIALWYWKQRGLSSAAQRGDVLTVTKGINGGTNGLADRKSKFAKYLTTVASSDGQPIKTAMMGGFLSKHFPTLVGEREPEVLGPDGRIHRSVDSYLSSPSADVTGLMTSTAVKEAMRRAGSGPDNQGADAVSKIMAAAGASGKSEELLAQMLETLRQIAGNTAPIGELAAATVEGNKNVSIDASDRSGGNIFAIGAQAPSREGPGMSQAMRRVVTG